MRKQIALIIICLCFPAFANPISKQLEFVKGRAYLKTVFKTDLCNAGAKSNPELLEIESYLKKIGALSCERAFPDCLPPKPGGVDLTRIYIISFPESVPVKKAIKGLNRIKAVEWAEPWHLLPYWMEYNDPRYDEQYSIERIAADRAHDLSTGAKTAGVAIVDMGVEMDHEDLEANYWVNPGEDLNGDGIIQDNERNRRDDDNNGKVDDFHGWDFVDNDNDPSDPGGNQFAGHGVHCAGIASAVTNNERGVASAGYNCGIIGIRAASMMADYSAQGIEYAARLGAKVISCSFGPPMEVLALREAVEYAYEHDVVVVAAAGNIGGFPPLQPETPVYPAAYDNVVAVCATNANDILWNRSNYGNWVNIAAPGVDIISAYIDNDYYTASGTSMATPLVAGAAVLIRAAFPALSAEQTMEFLYAGADDIEEGNEQYRNKYGAGRVNIYNSFLQGSLVNIASLSAQDLEGNAEINPGDTAAVFIEAVHFAESAGADSVIFRLLEIENEAIEILRDAVQIEGIEPGDTVNNFDDPLIFAVDGMIDSLETTLAVETFTYPGGYADRAVYDLAVVPAGVKAIEPAAADFHLIRAFPNPFNESVMIEYSINRPSEVSIQIYNLNGKLISTLHKGNLFAGKYNCIWDGSTKYGLKTASGLYIVELKSDYGGLRSKILYLR